MEPKGVMGDLSAEAKCPFRLPIADFPHQQQDFAHTSALFKEHHCSECSRHVTALAVLGDWGFRQTGTGERKIYHILFYCLVPAP